jgi:hypothetical protein
LFHLNYYYSTCHFQHASVPRALLLTTQPKVPVMWKVLASKYYDDKTKSKKIELGAIKDVDGNVARALGFTGAASDKSKVAVWKRGDESIPTLYDGTLSTLYLFVKLHILKTRFPNAQGFSSLSHCLPLLTGYEWRRSRHRHRKRICKLNLNMAMLLALGK